MCFKAGSDELETVKNLMAMSLKAVVAESLGAELEEIEDDSPLADGLGMDTAKARILQAMIADVFDGLEVNLERTRTFGDLLEVVVLREFEGLEEQPSSHAA